VQKRRSSKRRGATAVSAHREDHKVVEHPVVGPIAVDCDVMSDGDAELKIVITTAAPGSEDETRLRTALQLSVKTIAN
jgi:hypothetical protein